jgi:uncharacterized protein YdeI (YjbR/CyaY-like superfamily)
MPPPTFFATQAKLRAWLEKHHSGTSELWVGLYKKSFGRPSITWPQLVDEALCFGWIDGVRKSLDDDSYMIRLTPRKADSTWSAVNIKRAKELIALGLMHPAGLRAFEKRTDEKSAVYAYEQRHNSALVPTEEKQFRANNGAWEFFQAQPSWYRRTATYWVVSAKRAETRQKRLATLIEDSADGRTIAPLTRKSSAKPSKRPSRTRSGDTE